MVNCSVIFFLAFFYSICLKFSGGSIHCIYAAHCQNSSELNQHSCLPHILPSMWRTWLLPCFYSFLMLPSEVDKKKPLASGTRQVFVYFTKSPYHNLNETLQNSFRKHTISQKLIVNKNLSINPKKTQHSTHKAMHVPQCIYISNILLLKIHLKIKNFIFFC